VDGVWKTPYRSGVIKVQVRLQHVCHIVWFNSHALQFIHTTLLDPHLRARLIRCQTPMFIGLSSAFKPVTAVDNDIASGMLDKEPGHRDSVRFVQALIHFYIVQL
jgi:hypothetical protein